jgi:hypothetical protein
VTERPDFGQGKPWQRRHEESKGDFVNVRLNVQERAQLRELMQLWRLDNDSTALKMALEFALNVAQGLISKQLWAYLCSPRRVRPGPR